MEENNNVVVPDVIVNVDNVHLATEQFEVIETGVQQINDNLQAVNASIRYATMFFILLCIFQFYGLLRRASKKGGV